MNEVESKIRKIIDIAFGIGFEAGHEARMISQKDEKYQYWRGDFYGDLSTALSKGSPADNPQQLKAEIAQVACDLELFRRQNGLPEEGGINIHINKLVQLSAV